MKKEDPAELDGAFGLAEPKTLEDAVRMGLMRFGELYRCDLNPRLCDLWIDALAHLGHAPDLVLHAFRQVERSFIPTDNCPFPVPAHVVPIAIDLCAQAEVEAEFPGLFELLPEPKPKS